ncbi:MAG: EamA family transporter, partial [Verrucomicrobiaceae bacterium]
TQRSQGDDGGPGVIALGALCTGIAYVLFFRLIADIGPARALTVTFVSPVFGMVWSFLFLRESISPVQLIASAAILLGTALATGLLAPRRKAVATES